MAPMGSTWSPKGGPWAPKCLPKPSQIRPKMRSWTRVSPPRPPKAPPGSKKHQKLIEHVRENLSHTPGKIRDSGALQRTDFEASPPTHPEKFAGAASCRSASTRHHTRYRLRSASSASHFGTPKPVVRSCTLLQRYFCCVLTSPVTLRRARRSVAKPT